MKRELFFSIGIALAAGCGGDPGTQEPNYEGCATDENWSTFDDYESTARIKMDAGQVPKWLTPTMGMMVSASSPPTFTWQPNASTAGMQDGDVTCPQFQPASLHVLSSGLKPLHEPPVSGTVYDLHFSVDGSDAYRVLTTQQRAGVAASLWSSWSGKTITVTLYEAKMLRNDVVEGPYVASPLNVQITQ